ncbi:MAG: isochorismatase family protein [Planctomycetota bacterium]
MAGANPQTNRLARSPELMNAHDTALLVVDVQERILAAIGDADRVVWNTRRLVDGAGLLGVSAAWTEQYPEKLGGTAPELAERLAAIDAAGPAAKLAFSCGEHPAIAERWFAEGRRRVLISGVETHVCVQQTALDYLAAGFRVYVAVDAVASRHAIDHDTALRRLDSAGVTLTTTEAALCEWVDAAGTPPFKAVSALLKEPGPENA